MKENDVAVKKRPTSKKKRSAKKQKKKFIIVLSLFILLVLGVILFIGGKLGLIGRLAFNRNNIEVNSGLITGEGYTTWALFGVDSRDTGVLGKGTHSDTIIIASVNNETKEIKMASVFRDTYLDCAKKNEDYYFKANQAYFLGGPEQAISMLNKNLDLNIKDYVTVDFKALSTAIDMLGGIDVELTEEEAHWVNLYAEETADHTGMSFTKIEEKAGWAHLDGTSATGYARLRKFDSDYKRAERQRTVISKCVEKAKKADIITLNNIVDKVLPMCATSFSNTQLLGLAKDLSSINMGETLGFPIEKTTKLLNGPGDCVIPIGLEDNVVALHEFLYGEKDFRTSETVKKISQKIIKDSGIKPEPKSSSASSESSSKTTKKSN